MEDVAWQYPAEPVERAAVRFCEAIQRWRGKPELETVSILVSRAGSCVCILDELTTAQYKKKPEPRMSADDEPGAAPPMPIDALVHSNPTSPVMAHTAAGGRARRRLKKPSIDVYFIQVLSGSASGGGGGASRRDDGMWAQGTSGAGNKRYRDASDYGRPDAAKRMYT